MVPSALAATSSSAALAIPVPLPLPRRPLLLLLLLLFLLLPPPRPIYASSTSITVKTADELVASLQSSSSSYTTIYLAPSPTPYYLSQPILITRRISIIGLVAASPSSSYSSSSSSTTKTHTLTHNFVPPLSSIPAATTKSLRSAEDGDEEEDEAGDVVLDMQNVSRAFEVFQGGQLTLRNLTLRNGRGEAPPEYAPLSAPNGGGCIALYSTSSGGGGMATAQALTVAGCVLANCHSATGRGGAIMMYSPFYSALTIADSVFANNSAAGDTGGGAISFEISPASVQPVGQHLLVSHSLFAHNQAVGGNGGALLVRSAAQHIRLDGVSFVGNQAAHGGAIAALESLSAANTHFADDNLAAEADEGNAVSLLSEYAFFRVDNATLQSAQQVGLYALDVALQVQLIDFTPAPLGSVFTDAPTVPTVSRSPTMPTPQPTRPVMMPPTTPNSSTGGSTDTGLIAALASILGLLLMLFVAYQKRKQNIISRLLQSNTHGSNTINRLNSFEEMERAHNEQVNRRRGPNVLLIEDAMLFPYDSVGDTTCPICLETSSPCTWDTFTRASDSISRANMDDITLQNTYCRLTACGHMAHTACLITWIELNSRQDCPFCRTAVQSDLKKRWASTSGAFDAAAVVPGTGTTTQAGPAEMEMVGMGESQTRRSTQADDAQQESGSLVMASSSSPPPLPPASPVSSSSQLTTTTTAPGRFD